MTKKTAPDFREITALFEQRIRAADTPVRPGEFTADEYMEAERKAGRPISRQAAARRLRLLFLDGILSRRTIRRNGRLQFAYLKK